MASFKQLLRKVPTEIRVSLYQVESLPQRADSLHKKDKEWKMVVVEGREPKLVVADVSQTAGLAWDLGCGVLVSTFYPSLKFPERGLCGSERQDSPLQE
ncbi:hypothetical protein Y1Q_0003540 [Alligator mississippiensis]|uniref:Uncharacterized protein n=1 Tax=Alligator mississippiensis TaxID=8496 RepID=A0A151M4H7_ALLMI|nr:hypothetical protein Y1Q_0003540 [Alligator mississippiensis]